MPAQTNTNVSPYYDDFRPESNFHRVLFKPGYPVQARELTQSQTILQDQIERLASSFLKDGDNVVPGSFTYNNVTPYVRCSSITQGSVASEYIGYKLRGVSSGVVAEVDFATSETDEDDVTFYVTYLSSGDSTTDQNFLEGEILETDTPNNYTATVGVNEVSKPITTPPMGFGSIFSIEEGYYYVNGFMVRNDEQTITLDKYSIKPTYRVGFLVDEDFINSNEDPSLLDNSQGSSNFAAPGADRLKISLILAKRDLNSADPDFITLTTINQGNIQGDPLNTNKFNWITDLLARRTFDESGDYILTEFPIKPLDYVNSEFIDGVYDPDGDGLYPNPYPRESDLRLTFDEANAIYAINVSPGNAYVQGYNVNYVNPFYVYGSKARDLGFSPKTSTQVQSGYYIPVTNTSSTPDYKNNRGTTDTNAFNPVILYRNYNDGHTGNSLTIDSKFSDRRPLNYGNEPWKTFHIVAAGNIGTFADLEEEDGYNIVTIRHNRTDETSRAILVYPDRTSRTSNDSSIPDNQIDIGNSIVVRLLPEVAGTENQKKVIRGDEIGTGTNPTYSGDTTVLTSFEYIPIRNGLLFSKYFENDTLIKGDTSTTFNYNSTYRMGVLDTYFFTELALIDDPLTSHVDWEDGNFVIGEQSRAGAKLEQSIKSNNSGLVLSNIIGGFKNNENVRQVMSGLPSNLSLSYVPSRNPLNGIPAQQLQVKYVTPDGLTLTLEYVSPVNLSFYKDGGYITYSGDAAKVVDASYNNDTNELTVEIANTLGIVAPATVIASEMVFYTILDDVVPQIKRGRIAKRGEIAKLYFDDYIGNPDSPDGGSSGGGGNQRITTHDVDLTHPTYKGLRLPPESGLIHQDDANEWFYYSIKSLLAGEGTSHIYLQDTAPDDKNFGDLWIDPTFYSVSVWDGLYWIDVVAGSENGEFNSDPTNSLSTPIIEEYVKTGINAEEIHQAARKELLARANDFETPDPRVIDSNFDLSSESYVDISALGATIRLHTHMSSEVALGAEGQVDPDIYYDATKNSIELTDRGRQRVYDFPFFDRGGFTNDDFPRVDYKLRTENNVVGYAITFPAIIQNTFKSIKSFFANSIDPVAENFTADIATQSPKTTEVFTLANGSTFSGASGRNYLICDNYDGDASRELSAGDVVVVTNDRGASETKLVYSTTAPYGYGTTKAKSFVYLTTTLNGNVTSKQIQRIRLKSEGNITAGNLIQLQSDVIRSLETDPNITGINYQVYQQFVGSVIRGESQVIVTTSATNETIIPDINKFSITIAEMPGADTDTERRLIGRKLIASINEIRLEGKEVVLRLSSPAEWDYNVKVIAPIQVTNGKSRKKELIQDETLVVAYDSNHQFDPSLSPASQNAISLGKADVFKVKSMTTLDDSGNVIDIMDNYYFDNGQTEDIYGLSYVRRKQDRPVPTADVTIVFDYFKHDSLTGGFFSVDSYVHDDGIPFDKIPTFSPTKSLTKRISTNSNPPRTIELRDCVDFRPIVNSLTSRIPLLDISNTTDQLTNYDNPYLNGDAFVPSILIPQSFFQADLQFYLPKVDSLFLDKTGKVILISGEPSQNPVAPPDLSTGIRLYDIQVPAYTADVKQLKVKKFNYRRYTMKDIYDIDRRVDKMEDLVSLSLLESSALTTEVRDSVTGLGRFKNGVIVDPFRNHSKGNVGSSQYRASIDPKNTHLRPPFFMDQVELEERFDTDEARLDKAGYVNNNGIITCPFKNVDFINQNHATRFVNLQPYSVFTYEGNITLDPPVDTFRDITRLPDLVIEDNSIFDAMVNLSSELTTIGTVWSDWETNVTTERRNLGTIRNTQNNRDELRSSGVMILERDSGNSNSIQLSEVTETVTTSRNTIRDSFNVSTSSISNTSYGQRISDIQLASTMRTIPVYVKAERLKPNTRYYAFFDNVNVSDWFIVDRLDDLYGDGRPRYNGVPGSNPYGFGEPILSDSDGNINGVFLIPNGRSPVKGSQFFGRLSEVQYNTSGPTRSFTTGQRSFKFTSSEKNTSDITQIDGYAQTSFTSSGVIADKQETIVSTRLPEVTTSVQFLEDTRVSQTTSTVGELINQPPPGPVVRDPIAQTFYVDNTTDEGVFVSELDIFFKTKDNIQGVEAYLVSTEGGLPTQKILPHSRVVKKSNSIIRVVADLNGLNTATLQAGTTIVGSLSGAVGVVSNDVKFDNGTEFDAITNVNNTVYNVVLSNYQNEFIPGESIVPQVSPPSQATFTIVHNEVQIKRVDIISMGVNYRQDALIVFDSPDLPGGVRAEGVLKVSDVVSDPGNGMPYASGRMGQIYEIVVTNPGSGYTKPPSVNIVSPTGQGAEFSVRVGDGRSAVDMGVSVSDDATSATKFKFKAPVYLLSNQSYAFVVKCPTSLNYTVWISKLGENIVGTERRVSQQPNLGSIFRSSNNDVWTEDQTEDIKFNLRKCEFETNTAVNVPLQNAPLPMMKLPKNPIDVTEPIGSQNDGESIYGMNSKVIRIHAPYHGLSVGDYVVLENVNGVIDGNSVENIGGIPVSEINGFHKVDSVNIEYFTVVLNIDPTTLQIKTLRGGGNNVMCSVNRPFEVINMYSGAMTFKQGPMLCYGRSAYHAGVTLFNKDKEYVIDSEYEIPIMDSYYFNESRQVASAINEAKNNNTEKLNKARSYRTRFLMSTEDPNVSPVLDLKRTNVNVVRNLVDDPYNQSNLIYAFITAPILVRDLDYFNSLSVGDKIEYTENTGRIRSVTISDILANNTIEVVGSYDVVRSLAMSRNDIDVKMENIKNFGTSSFPTLPETATGGTTYAKWVSKQFVFANPCDGIQIKLSSILYDQNDITAYYSVKTIGSVDDATINWTPFNENVNSEGLPDNVTSIVPRSVSNLDPRQINADEWQTLVWSTQDISRFDSLAVKIVMTATNPAKCPVIDDIRITCTE